MEHTSLPWVLDKGKIKYIGKEGNVEVIAQVFAEQDSHSPRFKDAQFIVEACNTFEECLSLLVLLKDCLPKQQLVDRINVFLSKANKQE